MLSEEDVARARNRLAAGRVLAMELQPYLSKALLALSPFARPGLGTFAVDRRWRLYYDPQMCLDWSVEEIAAVWLHEVGHVMRRHAERFEDHGDRRYAEQWNHAADAAINSDLRESNILLPDPDVRFYAEPNPLYSDWAKGMTTEEMFERAVGTGPGVENLVGPGVENLEGPGGNSDSSSEQEKGQEDADRADTSDSSSDTTKTPQEDDTQADNTADNGGSDDGNSSSSEPPQDSLSDDTAPGGAEASESASDASVAPGDAGEPQGPENGADGLSEGDTRSSDAHDCGSGATGGEPRPYEEQNDDDGSLNEYDAEMVREQAARDIMDAYNRGDAPGGWAREADDILDPQVDWRQELRAWMRRSVASIAGQQDYSYSRPSRRSVTTSFYLPAMRSYKPPVVRIVLDTSGSMNAEDLALGLSEVADIVRQVGNNAQEPIEIVNCDAGAHTVTAIQRIEDFEIVGGGGTDMRVGIRVAAEKKPTPDVILTITDGGTPWPNEPHPSAPRAQYVVLLVESTRKKQVRQPPEWMYVLRTSKVKRSW